MKEAVLRKTLRVDANRQLHIDVPADMGDEFEVIILPARTKALENLSVDEQFMLATYSAVIESNVEEDAVWEQYVRS